ncbi:MAG: cation:proton antiporter subunit C [Gammaproteobacteria bacterium]|nr:cation:proton antiporter subunit C [Gammaproteobacteria bacterium]
MMEMVLYAGAVGLLVIGIAGLVLSHHLFRQVLALVIAEAGANLLLLLAGYRFGGEAPIWSEGSFPSVMVDPVPQAIVLTAIVIGVGIQALAIALLIRVRQQTGTLDREQAVIEMREALDQELGRFSTAPKPRSQYAPKGERPLYPVVEEGQDAR